MKLEIIVELFWKFLKGLVMLINDYLRQLVGDKMMQLLISRDEYDSSN